jgi:sugar lactone lactonase YvrE
MERLRKILGTVASISLSLALSGCNGKAASANGGYNGPVNKAPSNIFIADYTGEVVRAVAQADGKIMGQTVTAGDIYTIAGTIDSSGFSGDAADATLAKMNHPYHVAEDKDGNVYIADESNSVIRMVAAVTGKVLGISVTKGKIYTVAGVYNANDYAGDGGPAVSASLDYPEGVAVDKQGNLFIADESNNVIRMVAAADGTVFGRSVTAGNIYTVAGNEYNGGDYTGDGGPALAATLDEPIGLVVDPNGNLFIADYDNSVIRVVPAADGMIFGHPVEKGNMYTVAGNGDFDFDGDGGPALSAELYYPSDVAIDPSGNLYICDYYNHVIRVVAAADGMVFGVAVKAGNIYSVAGQGGNSGYSGDGGPALSGTFDYPWGIAVDGAGNLFIADDGNYVVRLVSNVTDTLLGTSVTPGNVYTVAGTGTETTTGDGGPANQATFEDPYSIALSPWW